MSSSDTPPNDQPTSSQPAKKSALHSNTIASNAQSVPDDPTNTAPSTANRYWHANIRLMLSLLSIWFIASFGAGIIFVDQLNAIKLGGYPLGFWFAQQGSIFIFVALIFFYVWRMKKIDHQFSLDD